MMDKKGDFSVVVFVFLTLLLSGYSLYAMTVYKSKVDLKLEGIQSVGGVLLEKKDLEFLFKEIVLECSAKATKEYFEEFSYLPEDSLLSSSSISDRETDYLNTFERRIAVCVPAKADEIIKTDRVFLTFFNPEFQTHLEIRRFLDKLSTSRTEIEISENKLEAVIKDFEIDYPIKRFVGQVTPEVVVGYKTNLKVELDLVREGLVGPERIFELIEFCKINQTCYDLKIGKIMRVKIIPGSPPANRYKIVFDTKKLFRVDDSYRTITIQTDYRHDSS